MLLDGTTRPATPPKSQRAKGLLTSLSALVALIAALTILGMHGSRRYFEPAEDHAVATADGGHIAHTSTGDLQPDNSRGIDGRTSDSAITSSSVALPGADGHPTVSGTGTVCRWGKYADFPPKDGERQPQKVIYVKTPKTGSSTVANVVARYAVEHGGNVLHLDPDSDMVIHSEYDVIKGMQMDGITEVSALVSHIRYNTTLAMKYLGVQRPDGTIKPPFAVTSLREPSDRLISSYFYAVHRRTLGDDASWVCGSLASDYKAWVAQCKFQTMRDYTSPVTWSVEDRHNLTKIINHYDHILVTEYMTESLLVMAQKLGLSLFDMLIIPEKTNSRTDYMAKLGEEGLADLTARMKARVKTIPDEQNDEKLYAMALSEHKKDFALLPDSMRKAKQEIEIIVQELADYCRSSYKWERRQKYVTCAKDWMDAHIYC